MKTIIKLSILIITLLVVSYVWPIHEWMLVVISWVQESGIWGAIAFSIIYIVSAVLLMPASILTLGAGFIYGPFWGTLLVSPVSVIAAFAAFSLSRSRLRSLVEKKVANNEHFNAVDTAVGKEGFKIVMLIRLSPLFPYTFLNYALGLTGVRPLQYVLASFLGMLPGTFLYTYLGSMVVSVTELTSAPAQGATEVQNIFMWVGLAVTLIVTAYITHIARKSLKETTELE